MEITSLGDSALILRVGQDLENAGNETLDEVLGFFDFLRRADLPGVTEVAPAYTTIAVFYDAPQVIAAGAAPDKVFEWLGGRIQTAIAKRGRPIEKVGRERHRNSGLLRRSICTRSRRCEPLCRAGAGAGDRIAFQGSLPR